jgi:phosphate transport system substrate-binding protein
MRCAAIFAALFLWIGAGPTLAEDVTLTSRDGSVEISGDILGYDGEFYRVDTVYGVLTIDGTGVICDGPGCPNLEAYVAEFTISGARTMGEVLMPALVESFASRNGYRVNRRVTDDTHFSYELSEASTGRISARILFRVTSTSEGFADLLANEADMVLSVRQALAQEISLAQEAGLGDLGDPRRSRIVALDAIVPIVSSRNPLRGVTFQGLARIFSGQITNWSALGGADAPISLHLRDEFSGLSRDFQDRVLADRDLTFASGVIRHASNPELADAVAADPLAIGIATYSETGNAAVLAIKGVCDMVSVARDASIKTEDYPLTAPLFIYTPARRMPVFAREFLRFVRSDAAQFVIDRAGFVDLRLQEIPLADQGNRLANAIASAGEEIGIDELQRMVARMKGTKRLSISFRFRIGGTDLDAQSVSNIDLLAQTLENGNFDGRKMILVGFTDGEGPAAANLRLARRRAETVLAAVLAAAPAADKDQLNLSADAFGEAMPMACDDSDWGRQINRRVEVWVD